MGSSTLEGRLKELPLERRTQMLWIYVCTWSTKPIPFTAQHLADRADVSLDRALAAIQGAVDRDWLMLGNPTAAGDQTWTKWAKPKKPVAKR